MKRMVLEHRHAAHHPMPRCSVLIGNSECDGHSPPPPSYMLLSFTIQSMEFIFRNFRIF